MPMTVAEVQKLYVAYFNRPADYLGLEYWKTQTPDAAAKAFAASAEYAATYAGMDVGGRVNAIYQNLFGHAADLPGLTYWSTQIQQGKLTIADVVVAVSNGAQGTDLAAFNAKVTAATAFTAALDTTAEATGYSGAAANDAAKAWLAGINSAAQATSATAKAALDATVAAVISATGGAGGAEGKTFVLSENADTITGTAGNDLIRGVLGDDSPGDGDIPATFNAGDDIVGGNGYDTLRLVSTEDADAYEGDGFGDGATVEGVEKLEIQHRNDDDDDFDIDMRAFDDALEHVQVSWSQDVDGDVSVDSLQYELKELTLEGVSDSEDLFFDFDDSPEELYSGESDSLVVNLKGVGRESGDYYVLVESPNYDFDDDEFDHGIETLVINSTGSQQNSLVWNDMEDVVSSIVIKGSADLWFGLVEEAAVKSIDASALNGDLTFGSAYWDSWDGDWYGDAFYFEESLTVKGAQGDNDFWTYGFDFAANKTLTVTTYAGNDSLYVYADRTANTIVADLGAGDDFLLIEGDDGADDVITLTANLGAGNDVIDLDYASRAAKIDVGSGEDAIIIAGTSTNKTGIEAADTNAKVVAGVITVTGFGSDDVLDLSDFTPDYDWMNATQVSEINNLNTLKEKVEYAFDDLGLDFVAFKFGSDSYIAIDADNNDLGGGDVIIKLVGFSGSLGSTASDPSWLID